MATTAKLKLKPYVAVWHKKLDACFMKQEQWCPVKRKKVKREVLRHPLLAEHTGWLHWLIEADYSQLVSKSEAKNYM